MDGLQVVAPASATRLSFIFLRYVWMPQVDWSV